MLAYADTSALAKLTLHEAETAALVSWIEGHEARLVTCELSATELLRATVRGNPDRAPDAREVLRRCGILRLDLSLYEAAGILGPADLRSLDAIHLAAALQLGGQLDVFLCYDQRLTRAATRLGLQTASPA